MKAANHDVRIKDAVYGCLFGGAIGDALGYPVEFSSYRQIQKHYGAAGITELEPGAAGGKVYVSDDTQMSLYTACGMLNGLRAGNEPKLENFVEAVYQAYLEWYYAQTGTRIVNGHFDGALQTCFVSALPEMAMNRAPGNTCLSALGSGEMGSMAEPLNNSKGCGTVMRVAPIALLPILGNQITLLDLIGAETSALTHDHPMGYIPGAMLVHMLARIIYGGCTMGDRLVDIVDEAYLKMEELFPKNLYMPEFRDLIHNAMDRAYNDLPDVVNIHAIGGGWKADEALAIAIYTVLRYPDDFDAALIASVNHNGDSDSTGALVGNLLGARLGISGINLKWMRNLEFADELRRLADSLLTAEAGA